MRKFTQLEENIIKELIKWSSNGQSIRLGEILLKLFPIEYIKNFKSQMEEIIMTIEKIKELVADHLEIDVTEITDTTTFQDLDADSLDTVEILMEIEDEFGVEVKQDEIGKTVADLAKYIDSKKN